MEGWMSRTGALFGTYVIEMSCKLKERKKEEVAFL